MKNTLDNVVAVVTGASRGIGKAIAIELAEAGAKVACTATRAENAADTAKTIEEKGGTARAIGCRVENANEVQSAFLDIEKNLGAIGLLVNNAGITSIGRVDLLNATEENWDALMAVNLKGPFFLSQLAARWMIEQAEADQECHPKIINISSVSAHAVSTNRGDYCVAKAGLGMVTKLFAARLADKGINVYEICPGVITSDMTAPVKGKYDKLITEGLTPIRRWGEPGDVGRAVAVLANGAFSFTTGDVFNVDGGFHIRIL